jgi:NADH:ubiquinone oxidoreductase subunit F (NADH-binding)/(2Fe-2S) ferredoxin/Pyruvate/2-oxoacid:ferredoxin oxidoreductase delta subunit
MSKPKTLRQFTALQDKLQCAGTDQITLCLCSGTGCRAYASEKVFAALADELKAQGAPDNVVLKRTGCHGFCERGPILIVYPKEICYLSVKPADAAEIVRRTVLGSEVIERLVWKENGDACVRESDIPFYKHQTRIVLANNARMDPVSIEDYIGCGGYAALAKALFRMKPGEVVAEIKASNLRGRGGGGFPTGLKWEATRKAAGAVKYVIVNGDEGDPGAYMDRSILEGAPHSVLEGLIIGAYAIGANEGFFYIRQEYPLALDNTRQAIAQAEALGLLGDDILGSGFGFRVSIRQGAGAFVSGESSALISAIEGRSGEPRLKYIRTSTSGLWNKPTNLNNVETWANVPLIISRGAAWYNGIGTPTNTGTKIFSLVGNVERTGLVEVPMGTTLRQIVYTIGGGIKGGRKFKAVQTGGPSGGCIPEQHLDAPIDFDALTALGSMMGSGGMIVMDEGSCMVDVARYYVEFLKEESCGKCIPCREGISEMVTILNRIRDGGGRPGDIAFLEDIATLLSEAALCGLGTTAASPVLSTIRYFRDEYEAHIHRKECPARVCKALIAFYVEQARCQRCLLCVKNCPVHAIRGDKDTPVNVVQDLCIRCGVCRDVCPAKFGAVKIASPRTDLPATATAGGGESRG